MWQAVLRLEPWMGGSDTYLGGQTEMIQHKKYDSFSTSYCNSIIKYCN